MNRAPLRTILGAIHRDDRESQTSQSEIIQGGIGTLAALHQV